MDRDERKLDVFLTFHRSSLLISDMKIFLPFTINLDPYIKKKIKEEQQSIEEDANFSYRQGDVWHNHNTMGDQWVPNRGALTNRHVKVVKPPTLQGSVPATPAWSFQPVCEWQASLPWMQMPPTEPKPRLLSATTTLSVCHKILYKYFLIIKYIIYE